MKKWLLLLSVLLALQNANAALISKDYAVAGDNLITLDTDSNLEWLDFSATRGISILKILSGTGGWISNFRYATRTEVETLLEHAGFPNLHQYNYAYTAQAVAFNNLFNTSGNTCDSRFACAFWTAPGGSQADYLNVGTSMDGRGMAYIFQNHISVADAPVTSGSALVRMAQQNTNVPEPGTIALLGLGLAALSSLRKRKV